MITCHLIETEVHKFIIYRQWQFSKCVKLYFSLCTLIGKYPHIVNLTMQGSISNWVVLANVKSLVLVQAIISALVRHRSNALAIKIKIYGTRQVYNT